MVGRSKPKVEPSPSARCATSVRRGAQLLAVLASLGLGCGTTVNPSPPVPEGEPLEIRVMQGVGDIALEPVPLEGATVAVDTTSGRFEAGTDADGWARFEAIEPAGVVRSIAHKNGYSFSATTRAAMDFFENDGGKSEIILIPRPAPTVSAVTLSGTAAGITGAYLEVGAHLPGMVGQVSGGAAWSIEVPPGEPFELFAFDWGPGSFIGAGPRSLRIKVHGWYRAAIPALEADGSHDIDFAAAAPRTLVTSGRFPSPVHPELREDSYAFVRVVTFDRVPLAVVGFPLKSDPTPDGEHFSYETEWIDGLDVPVRTQYIVNSIRRSTFAFVWKDGPPVEGDVDIEFVSPPDMILPHAPGPHPLREPLRWELAGGAEPELFITFVGDADENALGFMTAAGHEREVSIPELPSTSDPALLFTGTTLGATYACSGDPDEPLCKSYSQAPAYLLAP